MQVVVKYNSQLKNDEVIINVEILHGCNLGPITPPTPISR